MIARIFLFCFIVPVLSLCADLSDYFKKATDKSVSQGVRNVDFIYMINLDQRPQKFESSLQQLAPYGIYPYRFSAVNGWELSLEDLNRLGVKYTLDMDNNHMGTCYLPEDQGRPRHEPIRVLGRNYFCHCMTFGAVGIVLSHLSILQDAYDSGYETIWVMEDDVEVIRNPHLISDRIEELDHVVGRGGWDVLFTDRDTKSQAGNYVECTAYAWRPNFRPGNPFIFAERRQISSNLRQIGARYGAYSMIVTRSGMKKLLDFFKTYKIFLPYDMDYTVVPGIRHFTVLDDIVSTQIKALSDNGAPNYKNDQQ